MYVPTDIESAKEVIIPGRDYNKIASYPPNSKYSNYYAFDCEFVFVKADPRYPNEIIENDINLNKLTNYKEKNKNGYRQASFTIHGTKVTIDDVKIISIDKKNKVSDYLFKRGDIYTHPNNYTYIKINDSTTTGIDISDSHTWLVYTKGGPHPNPDTASSFVEFYGRREFKKDKIDSNFNFDAKDEIKKNRLLNEACEILHSKNLVSVLAQICIVDWNGKVIYKKYADLSDREVIWTVKKFSGIPQGFFTAGNPMYHKLIDDKGVKIQIDNSEFATISEIHAKLDELFKKKDITGKFISKIIGHSIKEADFPKINYPIDDILPQIRDTVTYFSDLNTDISKPFKSIYYKLKDLCNDLLFEKIQEGEGHDPSEDARAALALYKYDEENFEKKITDGKPVFLPRIERIEKKIKLLSIFTAKTKIKIKKDIDDSYFYYRNCLIENIKKILNENPLEENDFENFKEKI
jgi:hypothetical protein